MKYTEIEQKYRLAEKDIQLVKDALKRLDAMPVKLSHQTDTYYNDPHRDFLAPEVISEWLRVRVEDNTASLNYKCWHPVDARIKTHCDEYETDVTDPVAVTCLLDALGYRKITVVDKLRKEWITREENIAVAFDEVTGLGTYIEFEYKGEADSVETATGQLDTFIATLGVRLGERVHKGYPHLVLGR